MNSFMLLSALLLVTPLAGADAAQHLAKKKIQACALYDTDQNHGYPIPLRKCVEIRLEVNCDEKVLDSKANNKVWRSYPEFKCTAPNIKTGLSERYLLEGID